MSSEFIEKKEKELNDYRLEVEKIQKKFETGQLTYKESIDATIQLNFDINSNSKEADEIINQLETNEIINQLEKNQKRFELNTFEFSIGVEPPKIIKPPLGLKPKDIFQKQLKNLILFENKTRIFEILEACMRYTENSLNIPKEWLFELLDICVNNNNNFQDLKMDYFKESEVIK